MSLAQVVYRISTDSSFAAEWQRNPEAALAGQGLRLSREEMTFLSQGLKRRGYEGSQSLSDLVKGAREWRE
jgi:hypothetical protein